MIPSLANHLWQSTLFAGIAGLLTLALRRNHARARHALWLAASLKFLVPFSIFIGLGGQVGSRAVPVVAPPQVSRAVEQMAEPATYSFAPARTSAPLLPVWFCGFALVAAWRWRQWHRVRMMVRTATPSGLPFPIPVRSAPGTLEPGVYGIVRPILLLPAGIEERLSPAQLQAILAHELCHVRRYDNLSAALHMIVETIFWFHPLVWFIGARLVEERERACDEEVVRLGSAPETYAESILQACKLYLESPLACVSGVTGADLKNRIQRIMDNRISKNLTFRTRLLLGAAGVGALAAPLIVGMLHAQSELPSFEVATVKANHSGSMAVNLRQRPGGGLLSTNASLHMMIQNAYNLRPFQVVGGPSWLNVDRFDINAKATGATPEQVRLMLQRLLAERFKLAVHRETRELPLYSLVVAKGGPKLSASKVDTTEINGNPADDGTTEVKFQKVPMSMLARTLARMLQHQVSDGTGLTGEYDFTLRWVPDQLGAEEPGPSVFTALQEQLGLKLESHKGPVEVLVIDHVERTPIEN
jgi:bla regulator protein BlaR1